MCVHVCVCGGVHTTDWDAGAHVCCACRGGIADDTRLVGIQVCVCVCDCVFVYL